MSANRRTGSKARKNRKKPLTDEEKRMVELYQDWKVDEYIPRIIEYVLDFDRKHLELGTPEPINPPSESTAIEKNINSPPVPKEPEIVGSTDINQPSCLSPSSTAAKTGGKRPEKVGEERPVSVATPISQPPEPRDSKRIREQVREESSSESMPPPAAPVPKRGAETRRTKSTRTGAVPRNQQKEKPNGQMQSHPCPVKGRDWIHLSPKSRTSIRSHRSPKNRAVPIQGSENRDPVPRPETAQTSSETASVPESPADDQPKPPLPPVRKMVLRKGVVLNPHSVAFWAGDLPPTIPNTEAPAAVSSRGRRRKQRD